MLLVNFEQSDITVLRKNGARGVFQLPKVDFGTAVSVYGNLEVADGAQNQAQHRNQHKTNADKREHGRALIHRIIVNRIDQ